MSRLSQDFSWYYSDTYIGYKETPESKIMPFYISNVEQGNIEIPPWELSGDEEYEYDQEERDNYYDRINSEESYEQSSYDSLVFRGVLILDGDGNSRTLSVIGSNNPQLVFKNPLLGYVRESRGVEKSWMTYRPVRSVKKGLSENRVNHYLDSRIAWQIYDVYDAPSRVRDFNLDDRTGYVYYKNNIIVGVKEQGGVIKLDPLASHLRDDIEELFPSCQILIQNLS